MRRIISKFIEKEGFYVFGFSFFSKIFSFLISLLLIRILSPIDFGVLSYVLSSLAFFIPFSGGGMQHSYLRFASRLNHRSDRDYLFIYSLKNGLLLSLGVCLVLYLMIPWLSNQIDSLKSYFYITCLYLFGFFVFDLVKNRFRVENQNKKYAIIEFFSVFLVLIIGGIMVYFFSIFGFLFTYISVPLVLGISQINFYSSSQVKIPETYFSYGLWVGIGSIASQLMYSLDIFLIGRILQDPQQVAIYRTASILPIALFFIPNAYMSTYYSDLAKKYMDKLYLISFVKDYILLFSFIGIVLSGVLYFSSEFIVNLIFGNLYQSSVKSFKILIIGMLGAFVLRIPFGNLLAAAGKSKSNAFISFFMLLLNGLFNFYAIQIWGIMGAAIVTSFLFWLSGLISLILYINFLKRI